MATASLRHKFSPTLTLRTNLQISDSSTEAAPSPLTASAVRRITEAKANPANPATLGDPLATLVGPREDRDRDFNDKSLFSQTDLIAKINAGGMLHTLTTGLELGRHPHHHARRRRARARPGTGRGRTHHAGLASAGRLHAARR